MRITKNEELAGWTMNHRGVILLFDVVEDKGVYLVLYFQNMLVATLFDDAMIDFNETWVETSRVA